jgi:beta-N-acetylhexosaminidase
VGASVPVELPADLGDRIAASFHVADGALVRLGHGGRIGTVVRIDTVANIAVGGVPWGPFALLEASDPDRPAPAWLADAAVLAVDAGTPLGDPAELVGPVLVVGKDLHRHPFAVEAITRLRAARPDLVTVDMGWPGDDLALADVATFGASRSVAEALASVIGRAVGAASPVEAP